MTNDNTSQTPGGKDPKIWELAEKRASFKKHAFTYLIINGMLWGIWAFSPSGSSERFPWPVWTTIFWGVGLAFHYVSAYVVTGSNSVEKEYDKLMKKKQNS